MARRKKKKSWSDKFSDLSLGSLIFNPVSLMIFVSFAAMLLWNKYNSKLDLPVNRKISQAMLHLNEAPRWIQTDIPRVAVQESRLSEISLSETRASELVAASLAVQPWIKSVQSVRKSSTGFHVQLQYRRPAAIIETDGEQPVPVDDEGVVLDSRDFPPEEVKNYWRVFLPNPTANGLVTGRVWEDIRVTDSVLIANAWGGLQADSGLMNIVNRSRPTNDRVRLGYFELWTRRGGIVIWGNAPGFEAPGEASANEKIAAIAAFVKSNGPLDAQTNRYFDVRSGKVNPTSAKLAWDHLDFINLK